MKKFKVMKGEEVLHEFNDELSAITFEYALRKGIHECLFIMLGENIDYAIMNDIIDKATKYKDTIKIEKEGE